MSAPPLPERAPSVALKRLAVVEVDPERSHQHEFHAGALRVALGFGPERVHGRLSVVYLDDGAEPRSADGSFTLSNVRAGKPRSPEYHMYYRSELIDSVAQPGDLLVVQRATSSDHLRAIIARAGSAAEARLLDDVFTGAGPINASFEIVAAPQATADNGSVLLDLSAPTGPREHAYNVESELTYTAAIRDNQLPYADSMTASAQSLVGREIGLDLDPDSFLDACLDAETQLFVAIRSVIGRRRVAAMVANGASFDELAAFFMSNTQSARSRRGTSLQNHFGAVLDHVGVRYCAQCHTELGETPDFLFPGDAEYRDPGFPADRLRIVACKTTAKERWRQALNEASRVEEKYLLTLDEALTDDGIAAMRQASLRLFLPARILGEHYEGRPSRDQLGTVSELIAQLRAVE